MVRATGSIRFSLAVTDFLSFIAHVFIFHHRTLNQVKAHQTKGPFDAINTMGQNIYENHKIYLKNTAIQFISKFMRCVHFSMNLVNLGTN